MATDEIEPIHVQSWQLELAKQFSPNYIHVVQGLLSLAFDRAIVLGIAKKNPSRMIGNIKSKKTQVDFWTLEEFQKVISLLISMGENPLLIKERLGHEKIQTTLGTYGHLYPNTNLEVANKLTGVLQYTPATQSVADYTSNQHTAAYHKEVK